jgi:hypothetical protein
VTEITLGGRTIRVDAKHNVVGAAEVGRSRKTGSKGESDAFVCDLSEQEIPTGICRQVPVKARFGDNRNKISPDDKCKDGRSDHCHRTASPVAPEPSGRDQQEGAAPRFER